MDDSQAIRELLEAKERGRIPVVLDLDGKTDRILEIRRKADRPGRSS